MADKRYYLSVRVIILDSKGRCLLIRRSKVCHHFVGKWEWPGGKVDKGEVRLKVKFTGVVGAYGFTIAQKKIAVLCLEARLVGGMIRLSKEHDQYSWVPMKDLHKWDMIKGLIELVKNYMGAKKRGGKNQD
jgi:8-oxo-dGTP diphosphatase